MPDYPPYMNAYGNVTKILNKIKEAQTPERFSQDYLETVLGFSGGGNRPFIPLAKRIGLVAPDGSPTELYRKFRNPAQSEQAMAQAIRIGYPELYKRNEYAHAMDQKELKGLVMEVTGLDSGSKTLRAIVATFEALKGFANFELEETEASDGNGGDDEDRGGGGNGGGEEGSGGHSRSELPIRFGYTINLNLPDTSNPDVFNAIFKALRENLFE